MTQTPGARAVELPGGVMAAWSDASRGDLRPTGHGPADGVPLVLLAGELAEATHSRVDKVAWVTQVHGSQVHAVQSEEKAFGLGPELLHLGEADALVSASSGVALCVLTADCAPLALASAEGVFGAVHAGWRGLHAGVVEAAVDRMRGWGATEIVGSLGPCIHVECYEKAPKCAHCDDIIVGEYLVCKGDAQLKLHKACVDAFKEKSRPYCVACQTQILDRSWYTANGLTYHARCRPAAESSVVDSA